jgi:excisionase family DNA binding protein
MDDNPPGPPEDEWLTVAQVVPLLGLSDSRVQRLLRAGQIPARKVGRDWIVSRRAVDQFLAQPPGRPGHPRAVRGR